MFANVIVNLLMMFVSSNTAKTLARKAVRKVVESKGSHIDSELATALLNDVAESKGNPVTKDMLSVAIEEMSK